MTTTETERMDLNSSLSLVVRIYRGVADHIHIRWTEWVMIYPTFLLWGIMQIDVAMFEKSRSFDQLAQWATQETWAFVMGLTMVFRLAALLINGTFKGVWISPHIRLVASLIGILVWSQYTLGFLIAYFESDGALSGALWSTFVVVELVNLYRSGRDVAEQSREQ